MDLPDCPPGAEGYQDSVTEVPRKPDDSTCTKAEQEFLEHLNSLKIKLEDGSTRPMVERNSRDIAGKWIYLCYPCAAVCSGETILQTHLSGKKHMSKLAMQNVWPLSIFDEHPYHQPNVKTTTTNIVQQKMPQEDLNNQNTSGLENQFGAYRNTPCHIQDALDAVKAPLIGLEYLIEHPPEQAHYEPKYLCTLCSKQGHPRTIINHMTCFWHRYNFILRHFPKACGLLTPYRFQSKYREGVGIVINRLASRIEDKYGRKRPINIDKEDYEKDKDLINQWIFKSHHFAEKDGCTFEEVVDIGLIDSLLCNDSDNKGRHKKKEPSPPVVAAPSKPHFNHFSRPAGRQERRAGSVESLSDISDDPETETRREAAKTDPNIRERGDDKRRAPSPFRSRFTARNNTNTRKSQEKTRAPNYEYKIKLASDKRAAAEEFARKTLAYHEKNPEKHPLYPEEWKKFWNKRYKEIQAEGKDPSKHDFKADWIVFWTARMKVLHDEELRVTVNEIYRKMCLSPPDMSGKPPVTASRSPEARRGAEPASRRRRRSPEVGQRSGEVRHRSPEGRRRSPEARRRSPEARRRSPDVRRRRTPDRRRSPEIRHRSPLRRRSPDFRKDRRSPNNRRSPGRLRRSSDRHRSPLPIRDRTRSRSPMHRRSPPRARMPLNLMKRSRSPLSQREMQPRNRSPEHSRDVAPSLQTVLISDDELKPDDGLSPWNSDNDIASVGSANSPTGGSVVSRGSRAGAGASRTRRRVPDTGAPDDVVATLRLLVALEDYLGSLGPKLVDLLGEALKMEKDKANSSEELLLRESAVVLIETAKEKLKGATQAGLVTGSAAAAARAAVVRAAATLHEADKRTKRAHDMQSSSASKKSAVPVAGIGEVDRAQIAQQMAEALIAQGKTDVSSEELAQLVDAVVGMAEAKKREAEKKQPEIRSTLQASQHSFATPKTSGTASALQMLQSAYDENDKRIEKEEAPDAMDGLSDSDLETLLKNFNELSAEEQHSLIAYLKKLEAREPTRVERLRKYVSDAAHAPAPASAPAAAPVVVRAPSPPPASDTPLLLDSDDDDYTVEEVFQSATLKVREDQIRQEMEIVKKSLEETKPPTPTPPSNQTASETTAINSIVDITRNLSSASDLFALVQASIKSTPAPTPAPIVQPPEVVASSTQPRSFGDLPETPMATQEPSKSNVPPPLMSLIPTTNQSVPLLKNPPQSFVDNRNIQPSNDYDETNQLQSEHYSHGNQPPIEHYHQGPNERFGHGNPTPNERFAQGNKLSNERFGQGNQPPNERYNQGNQPSNDRFGQSNHSSNDRFGPGNQPPNERFGQGNQPLIDRFGQSNQPPNDRFGQGNQPPNDRFGQGNQPPNDRFGQGNQPPNDRFGQGNQPPNDRFGQGNQPPNDRFGQGNQPPNDRFGQGNQPPNDPFGQGNQPPNDRFGQGNQPPNDRFGQGNQPPNDRFGQGNQPQNDRFSQGNQPPNDRFGQGNQPPNDRFGQGNQPPNDRFGQGNQPQNDHFGQGNQPPNDRFSQGQPPNERFGQGQPGERFGSGNPPQNERFGQGNPPTNERFGQGNERYGQGNQWNPRNNNMATENRGPPARGGTNNPAPLLGAPYSLGPRPNFMNGRGQDNRQANGNQQQFRGRGGRGHYGGGPMRGRGRGYY